MAVKQRGIWVLDVATKHETPNKMATLIQRVGRQALATFMAMDASAFPSNFERLKALVSLIAVVNCL